MGWKGAYFNDMSYFLELPRGMTFMVRLFRLFRAGRKALIMSHVTVVCTVEAACKSSRR